MSVRRQLLPVLEWLLPIQLLNRAFWRIFFLNQLCLDLIILLPLKVALRLVHLDGESVFLRLS